MLIQVLGTANCSRCSNLTESIRSTAAELNVDATVEKVVDVMELLRIGVMTVPSVIIDGKPVAVGRIPSTEEIRDWLKARKATQGKNA